VGGFGAWRHWNGVDGTWFLLASAFLIGLIVGHSRGQDGSPRWNERTVFVVFAGGLIGLALVALQPDTVSVVSLGVLGVSLVTARRTPMKPCAACARPIKAQASKCLHCGEGSPP
jgi:cell division protein FtsW (lipid II flippase)